jgi:hypothetical protein
MKVDKQERKYLKSVTKDVIVASLKLENDTYNGLTVAYKPAVNSPECRMLEVAVSYCAPEDKYKASTGKGVARLKFISGEIVKVPLGLLYTDYGSDTTSEVLLNMFHI